jgi:protocatechuate 3,4-dioxygenase beta subunit
MDDKTPTPASIPLSRRQAITALGGLVLGLVAVGCGSKATPSASSSSASTTNSAVTAGTVASCVLTPEVTEGPYFIQGDQVRGDITEGHPGAPLSLAVTVVDATTCAPIKDASVDIWHCDAGGVYAGFEQAGLGGGPGSPQQSVSSTRFLRGIQMTDANGVASFATIYPGWYQGRTVHIHVKVGVGSDVHTGQIFFDDTLTDAVFKAAPYAAKGAREVRNADDGIFRQSSTTVADVVAGGSGYTGTIVLGVQA